MTLSPGVKQLQNYLEGTKTAILNGEKIQIIMGNEAADLDSMGSAVIYAYCKAMSASSDDTTIYVPMINIPREDFKLRTEAAFLFSHAGINTDWLLFAEDINLNALNQTGNLELVLVDHNKLASNQSELAQTVEEIIDHHKDEQLYMDAARVIEPVGSAATLVAEALLKNPDALEEGSAVLLLGTILLDTVNLDPDAQRATEKDQQIVDALLKLTGADRKQLFDKLQEEKFNVSSLDSSDLLRKDYKEWKLGNQNVGFASVLLSISDWLTKDADLSGSLAAYASRCKLDVLIAMNAYTQPQFTRELVVYCKDDALRSKLLKFLEGSDLGLTKIEGAVDADTALYAQANLGYSRKKLQPVMNDFFTSL